MGVDAGDFDGDGDEDLFMVHISGETNTLYLNDGNGIFSDGTVVSGLASPSWNYTGFGAGWIDFDNDGLLDLLIVNGAVKLIESQVLAGDPYPLHQPNQLFRNLGDGRFEEVSAAAGPAFALSEVSRGAAFGDLDNDGDVDVVVTNNSGPARLLDNRIGSARRWIGLRVLTAGRRRDALGARIAVSAGTPAARWRRVRSDGSYASSSDPRVVVGLGAAGGGDEVLVVQPGGRRQRWLGLSPGRYYTLAEGIPAEAQ